MTKKKTHKHPIYFYGLMLAVILGTISYIFYTENNKGILKVNTTGENISIFIDGQDKGISNITEVGKQIKLKKGVHSILISKPGFWPWLTAVEVLGKQTLEINPFFIPENANGYIIPEEDPEYQDIINSFYTKTLIDWEMNENTPEIITNFESEIRASDFYKDRQDVVIVAVENGVYALEINSSSTPNFQPIFTGVEPTFVKKDSNSIYVKDGKMLMEVVY